MHIMVQSCFAVNNPARAQLSHLFSPRFETPPWQFPELTERDLNCLIEPKKKQR